MQVRLIGSSKLSIGVIVSINGLFLNVSPVWNSGVFPTARPVSCTHPAKDKRLQIMDIIIDVIEE